MNHAQRPRLAAHAKNMSFNAVRAFFFIMRVITHVVSEVFFFSLQIACSLLRMDFDNYCFPRTSIQNAIICFLGVLIKQITANLKQKLSYRYKVGYPGTNSISATSLATLTNEFEKQEARVCLSLLMHIAHQCKWCVVVQLCKNSFSEIILDDRP